MDLIDQANRLVKVRVEELESKIRSKRDLYYVLRQCCTCDYLLSFTLGQYYLPQESHSSIRFLKDVLSGKKKVSKDYFTLMCRHLNRRILKRLLFHSFQNLTLKTSI